MSGFTSPSAEEQIRFLQRIQRLMEDGEFQATYKFALLIALAELSVELGDDSGSPLPLPMTRIAEKFAELYWRQMAPYVQGGNTAEQPILQQNRGRQVSLVSLLMPMHEASGGRLSVARCLPAWEAQMRAIGSLIRKMPLYRLQVVDREPMPFLYEHDGPRDMVELKSGVAFNLRRYQSLIQQFARSRWVEHIRSNQANAPLLGGRDDLEAFMFGTGRASLDAVQPVLRHIQNNRCFYCGDRLTEAAQVDHFIAWARYPRDTAHNFVVAHGKCNNAKRDLLPAAQHLTHWLEHLHRRGDDLAEALGAVGFIADPDSSLRVAHWAYRRGVETSSPGWIRRRETETLGEACLALLGSTGA